MKQHRTYDPDLDLNSVVALPLMRAGSIKAYAVTSETRLAFAPDIPTFGEVGFPGLTWSAWLGFFAPKGTPRAIISKLNAASAEALLDLAVRSRLVDFGFEIYPRERQTPGALAALVKADAEKWWPIIKELGIKGDRFAPSGLGLKSLDGWRHAIKLKSTNSIRLSAIGFLAETLPTVSKTRPPRRRPIEAALLHGRLLRVKATELPRRRFLHLAAGAAALSAVSSIARAQTYPTRRVRVIVPFGIGGATDVFARLVTQKLSERLGKQFYVEKIPGAGGNIGTGQAARAAPDGHAHDGQQLCHKPKLLRQGPL
jgi:hypothetical protein